MHIEARIDDYPRGESDMENERDGLDQAGWLSEDEVHRLLARAVELDAQYRAAVSVEDLQRAAREAGIESGAFVQALTELRSGALEPITIGQRVSARLARFRRPAALATFVAAAAITPGDLPGLTTLFGMGLYGAFEGLTALARYWGKTPPRLPPDLERVERSVEERDSKKQDPNAARFVLVAGPHFVLLDPSTA